MRRKSDRLLGRKVELIVEDGQSQAATAVKIYEKLITQDKVNAILGPYSSPITEAVADVSEKYRMPMVASGAASASIFKKGRRFVVMVYSPAEVYLEGLIDIAAKRGLKTLAIFHQDTLVLRALAQGAVELAKKKGLQVVVAEAYPKGTLNFRGLFGRLRAANPDVVAAATYFNDAVAITRQLKELNINPKLFGVTVGSDLPKFYETLGRDAEFVYGASQWEAELALRSGGLVPIAAQFPAANEFVEAYRREFPKADFSYHSAGGYAGCEVLLESIRRASSLDGEKVRAAMGQLDYNNVFGRFKVDQTGFQIAHKMVLFQWQDGKKVIVWPEELAAGRPIFPMPPWNQRK